jgi:lysine 2,3-aminomutase
MKMKPEYIASVSELDNLVGLAPKEREKMETVTELFPFRSNEYYLSLIDWKDGHDPLRRIVVPDSQELEEGGSEDPLCKKDYTRKPGLQHKYNQTGLLLLTDICGGICRFCFRKRLFVSCERETVKDVSANVGYIRENPLARWFDGYSHALTDFEPKKLWLF